MYYGAQGEELKRFHTHDGHGLALARRAGVQIAIITNENSPIAAARAAKLQISELHLGITDKLPVLEALCAHANIPLSSVAYVGDDLGDLAPMEAVAGAGGIPCAVADARPEIRRVARYLCPSRGGYGAVRDVCDCIVGARVGA